MCGVPHHAWQVYVGRLPTTAVDTPAGTLDDLAEPNVIVVDRRGLDHRLERVQLGLGEVGERRVVAVDALHGRIGEEHRAAPVGLQAVLVGVDDDRVALRDRGVLIVSRKPRFSSSS